MDRISVNYSHTTSYLFFFFFFSSLSLPPNAVNRFLLYKQLCLLETPAPLIFLYMPLDTALLTTVQLEGFVRVSPHQVQPVWSH